MFAKSILIEVEMSLKTSKKCTVYLLTTCHKANCSLSIKVTRSQWFILDTVKY